MKENTISVFERREMIASFPSSTDRGCSPILHPRGSDITERIKRSHFFPNRPTFGFSFFSHSIYQNTPREQFIHNIQKNDWSSSLLKIHLPMKVPYSEQFFIFDDTSDFNPKTTVRIKLKVKKVSKDLPDNLESQILTTE
jgi:hypothetical protein